MTNKKKPDSERRSQMVTVRMTHGEHDALRELACRHRLFEAEVIRNFILKGNANGEAIDRTAPNGGTNWISVKKKKPKNAALGFFPQWKDFGVAEWKKGNWYRAGELVENPDYYPSHWTELPKPPGDLQET